MAKKDHQMAVTAAEKRQQSASSGQTIDIAVSIDNNQSLFCIKTIV